MFTIQDCSLSPWPEKLEAGKFNLIASNGDVSAILWKDGEYFIVGDPNPDNPIRIPEGQAFGMAHKGFFTTPIPIPLEDVAEWREVASMAEIPLGPYGGPYDFSDKVREWRQRRGAITT
ncbi:MAG: hypothetical protein HYT48_01915 [Candidatus Vogelbacteria bacterium]|nr:hypothetical protein [Candidatus Vogelbacteria bacterium]